ncbi:MAG: c-type cytochrome [Chthoniobacter sp.]|nr:c-type cytochrome [Chthoniobacter sp.]
MKLIASEPLIHEPSGVCWDEGGRMFVCELHGYNVEGQYDIDELNKTGKLDMEVRRIQASEAAKQRAKADNYGTVKLLLDTDGDGVMDKAVVWADRLPLCYGVVPARGGVIVACPPDIVYLSEKNGEVVRETLFTGFGVGQPERGVNAPTWGVDNWIYFGRGHSGGTITGPHLKEPIVIGNTDFRIRADGSAIEPVTGSTKTIGMTFTEGGDRFVTTTTSPGLFVTPIPSPYFRRNADAAAPLADAPAASYNEVFPVAPPHPWRVRREQHAAYFAFYKKISLSDAAASGYFTSVCSPLVYQDTLMPDLHGQYLVCEPAQNLVHRAQIERDGTRLRLARPPQEQKSEFLASSDPWFHPIGLQPTPDGSIAVIDFYREIIEDYSAIPRHLQQQYGVINGRDRGRIWLLTKEGHKPALSVKMDTLDDATLMHEFGSDIYWRRLTARRLLIERQAIKPGAKFTLPAAVSAALAMLSAFEGNHALTADHLLSAWHHPSAEVRRQALQIADRDFEGIGRMVEKELLSTDAVANQEPQVLLQMALSLGNSASPQASEALVNLARTHGDLEWMDAAVASSGSRREAALLTALATPPAKAARVMENLAGVIASRGNAEELTTTIAALTTPKFIGKALDILKLGLEETKPLAVPDTTPVPTAKTAEQIAALEKRLPEFAIALKGTPNLDEGRALFASVCGVCHRSHGIGNSVGPDLDAEFQRAPEVILRDILFPDESQRPGFETVMAKTQRGETLIGIAASDSPTSVTLRLPGGAERTVLRKRATISTVRGVSLMPGAFGDGLTPAQVANIIAFLREHGAQPPPK